MKRSSSVIQKKKKKNEKKKTSYSSETISPEYVVDDMAVLQGKKAKYKE
jgi:ribosomal protein S19